MFNGCSSLTYLNLSNFNTNYFTIMTGMLKKCEKLTKNNLIAKDTKILNQL